MAYLFNGTTQNLSAPPPVTGGAMSYSCWFYPTVITRVLVSIGVSGALHRNQLTMSTGQYLQASTVGSVNTNATTSVQYSLNAWSHGCAVFDTSYRQVYLNGAGGTADFTASTQNTFNDLRIGARYATTLGNYFAGNLAEAAVWNARLTADEAASLAKGISPRLIRPQSLVFYAPLIRDLIDIRGGLTIANNNGATVADHPRIYY